MKIIYSLFLCVFFSLNSDAQSSLPNQIDSLKTILSSTKEDTAKVTLLLKSAILLTNEDPQLAIRFSEDALLLSKKLKSEQKVMHSLNGLGFSHFVSGNYSQGLKMSLEGLKLSQTLNDSVAMMNAYNIIGNIYRRQKAYRSAINNVKRGLEICLILNKNNPTFEALLGITYLENGQMDSAMIYLQNAYQKYNQFNHKSISTMYNRLGDLQHKLNNRNLAIEYYHLGITSAIKENNPRSLCFNYVSMANLYLIENQTDSSIFYGRKAYELGKGKFLQQAQQAAKVLSDNYAKLKQTDSCLTYLKVVMDVNDKMFSNKEESQIQNLILEERLQKIDAEAAQAKIKLERSHNIQNSAIAVILLLFILLFLMLSHSIIVNESVIRTLGVLFLLIIFEFINLLIHPYIGNLLHHSPILMLGTMVLIAFLLIPLHHKLEHWITNKMVEKNKKIRLNAAKKILAELEDQKLA